ncbi:MULTISPECIES: hypothetical protein [Bacillus cereus group]|uniref:hypothetical protein n=1 Tax=Bacillus cereus group TaxID=86661 RepID=UPI0018CD6E30|nr:MULTISPECIES: hypothetical protein [Bacillus cereus group]MBG9841773.1 hypothetical protein [Bacillus tropicus]MBG9879071.1 hypothetical protein [Bacillus tropicus]MBG9923194.1 hypothetical protein [Bacillus tropicus]MBJ8356166.1 hypothetical protein [Bacillus mycoides]MED2903809.1 hypothetical protein [Bacillus tropicus]
MLNQYCYLYDEKGRFTGETAPIEYEFDSETQKEIPILPPNGTLLEPIGGVYDCVFTGSKWEKVEEIPFEPPVIYEEAENSEEESKVI